MATIIVETSALTWFQILPLDQKSSMPYQFNNIHVLPNIKHPFPNTPLDSMIAIKHKFLRKKKKIMKNNLQGSFSMQNNFDLRESDAEEQGLILINEYDFPHAIYEIPQNDMTSDGLMAAYRKITNFLGFKDKLDMGVTCIVTPNWMFVATIQGPYHTQLDADDREIPVYHDGFSYAGIVNIQNIEQAWPATAGIGHQQHGILDSLKKQAEPIENY